MEAGPSASYCRASGFPRLQATSSPAEIPCSFSPWGRTEIGQMKAYLASTSWGRWIGQWPLLPGHE